MRRTTRTTWVMTTNNTLTRVASLELGGNVLDGVLRVDAAVVLLQQGGQAGVVGGLLVLVPVHQPLKVGVVRVGGLVVVVVDVQRLVRVLDAPELARLYCFARPRARARERRRRR